MAAVDVTVAVLPEQVIGGYPAEDLVQWRASSAARPVGRSSSASRRETASLATVFVLGITVAHQRAPLQLPPPSCTAGAVLGLVPKEKLPTYNVFYEARTFSAAARPARHRGVPFGDLVFEFDFGTLAVEVCEDVWSPDGPMRRRCYAGAELI
jgi:NAD+ synthase (glutamine-hydrolysing)